jgi:hypothetical protein
MKQSINFGVATPNPQAFITRTKDKSHGRLKVYSNNSIFLEKQEEFCLELFNPTEKSILVKIEINGKMISSTGLVLKPAQRVFLERYFDVDKKFLFDVYEIENWETLKNEANEISSKHNQLKTELSLREQLLKLSSNEQERISLEMRISELKFQTEEMLSLMTELNERSNSVKEASKYNGKIRIYFYNEMVCDYTSTKLFEPFYPFGGGTLFGGMTTNTFTSNLNDNYTSNNCVGQNSIFDGNNLFNTDNISLNKNLRSKKDIKETGRIEHGSISNQKFETVNMNFSPIHFHNIEYTILPISEKPLEMKDIRNYCRKCGKKLSQSDNFCSSCGEKV